MRRTKQRGSSWPGLDVKGRFCFFFQHITHSLVCLSTSSSSFSDCLKESKWDRWNMNDVESSIKGVHGSKQGFLFGRGVSDVKSLKFAVQLTVTLRCGRNQTLNQGHSRFVSWTSFCSITSSHCEQFRVFSLCQVFYFGPSSLPAVLCPTSCPPHMLSAA